MDSINKTSVIKKYQNGGSNELDPAVITDSFTGKGKIKELRRQRRQARRDNRQLRRDLKSYDYITDQSIINDFITRIENSESTKTFNKKIKDAKDEYRSKNFLGIGDGSGNALPSQLYRYWSRHFGHQKHQKNQKAPIIFGDGTDIIDLSENVIRLTPESQQSTALFNEFVESRRPSVHPAKKYQSGEIKFFGDMHNIPTDNISLYAGVEDGKFKTDSLYNFNPNTTIYPARNVKRGTPKIHGLDITLNNDDSYKYSLYHLLDTKTPGNEFEAQNLAIQQSSYDPQLNEKFKNLARNLKTSSVYNNLSREQKRKYNRAANRFLKNKRLSQTDMFRIGDLNLDWNHNYKLTDDSAIHDFYRRYITRNDLSYNYIDADGNKHPISDYDAAILDNKMVFGNPKSGLFIGDFKNISQRQLDSLNSWLRRNPSWLVRPDLGSFDQYRLDGPTLEAYLKQYYENPSPNDPNVYTVGTTEDNKIWE